MRDTNSCLLKKMERVLQDQSLHVILDWKDNVDERNRDLTVCSSIEDVEDDIRKRLPVSGYSNEDLSANICIRNDKHSKSSAAIICDDHNFENIGGTCSFGVKLNPDTQIFEENVRDYFILVPHLDGDSVGYFCINRNWECRERFNKWSVPKVNLGSTKQHFINK